MKQLDHIWTFVSKKQDIPVLGARVVTGSPVGPIAIFRTLDDSVFAVLDKCPHKGGPLSQGIVHGHAVACPLHAWNISLVDGCAQAPDAGCARHFAIKCEEDNIYLMRAELAGN